MAIVTVSQNVTDKQCAGEAGRLAQAWQTYLTAQGSNGDFVVEHGHDLACREAHGRQYDEALWIVTTPRGCTVFTTIFGNPSDYVSAATPGRYVGIGNCPCGHQH
ncbi:hypothetical protein WMF27_37320 [Sorangium sp. So ce281]|uniref:hypothetical protein n=1 Tax=Sorangium sp. So ce281 TaxID=3133293 RepID=UPI003F5DB7B1